jgi:bis(5'-nucleosyl)-tetraphosphatase (symmetrical)
MATYAIGDVQGCFDELNALLQLIKFDETTDQLWLTGDLVNRGPKSLAVLRFLRNLKKPPIMVLGNHDLHLLAAAYGVEPVKEKDTFSDILNAVDGLELCDWLRQQPLLYHDADLNFTLVHAGLLPQWDLAKAQQCALEVSNVLREGDFRAFLHHMYGSTPTCWDEKLTGWDRLRFITNCFTRIRFCDQQGHLDLRSKGKVGSQPAGFMPWFKVPGRLHASNRILFGHWAALEGKADEPNVYALDTGCVWGRCLTAMRLEDQKLFSVNCSR